MKLVNIHKHTALIVLLVIFSLNGLAQKWTLEQCLDTARINNKGLQIAVNEAKMASAKHKEAQYGRIPKLIANGEYKYYADQPTQLLPISVFGGPDGQFKEAQFGVPHNLSANLQLVMPLYDPLTQGAVRTSGIAELMGSIRAQKTEEQLVADITTLYYNAQVMHHQLAYLDSNIINSSALLNNLTLLRQQLMATGTDVSKVQLQLDQVVSKWATLQSNSDQVLELLRFSIGLPLTATFDIVPEVISTKLIAEVPQTTLDQRLAAVRSDILFSELRLLKQSRLPSVSLFGAYGTTGYGYDEQPNDFLDFYPISFAGLSLKYPLFNGMVTRKKIEQKELELDNSKLQIELLEDKTSLERKNAERQLALAERMISDTEQRKALAQEIYTQVLLQQKQGLAGLTEVLMADNALREAQQEHISSMIDYLRSTLEMQRINGRLIDTKK